MFVLADVFRNPPLCTSGSRDRTGSWTMIASEARRAKPQRGVVARQKGS